MKKPLPSDRTDTPLEKRLYAAALWEPDTAVPADFAAFTRHALSSPRKQNSHWINAARWVAGLRSPLAVGLASVCVLWVGGNRAVRLERAALLPSASSAATFSPAPAAAPRRIGRLSLAPWPDAAPASTRLSLSSPPLLLAADDTTQGTWHGNENRFSETASAASGKMPAAPVVPAAAPSAAPLWKNETVERSGWGALIPVPAAEADGGSPVETSEPGEGEVASAILPVVIDVALPDGDGEERGPTPSQQVAVPASLSPVAAGAESPFCQRWRALNLLEPTGNAFSKITSQNNRLPMPVPFPDNQ